MKSESPDHLLGWFNHPIRRGDDLSVALDRWTFRAIEDEDGVDDRCRELGQSYEEGTKLRVFTCLSMFYNEIALDLAHPNAMGEPRAMSA